MTELTCAQRVDAACVSRSEDLRALLDWDGDESHPDLGDFWEYGLELVWVYPDEAQPYLKFLLCTGGPHEELRFWCGPDFSLSRAEFLLEDWFDTGTTVSLGPALARDIWEHFMDCDIPRSTFKDPALWR